MPFFEHTNWRWFSTVLSALMLVGAVVGLRWLNDLEETTYENRVNSCRILKALDQLIIPDGPCDRESVRASLERYPVRVIGSTTDHDNTQHILCEMAEANNQQLESCKKE